FTRKMSTASSAATITATDTTSCRGRTVVLAVVPVVVAPATMPLIVAMAVMSARAAHCLDGVLDLDASGLLECQHALESLAFLRAALEIEEHDVERAGL